MQVTDFADSVAVSSGEKQRKLEMGEETEKCEDSKNNENTYAIMYHVYMGCNNDHIITDAVSVVKRMAHFWALGRFFGGEGTCHAWGRRMA